MRRNDVSIPSKAERQSQLWLSQARTVIWVAVNGEVAAAIALSDIVKAESKSTVSALRNMGVDVWLLTGDNFDTAHSVARLVGIPARNVIAETRPEDKLTRSRRSSEGKMDAAASSRWSEMA